MSKTEELLDKNRRARRIVDDERSQLAELESKFGSTIDAMTERERLDLLRKKFTDSWLRFMGTNMRRAELLGIVSQQEGTS